MSKIVEEIIKGRKVFFITPDKSLFPQVFLEDFMAQGYECYFVDSDIFLPIEIKVDIILSIFKDSILYFNIDAPIQNNNWIDIIRNLQKKHPDSLFGIMYAKRQSPQEKQKIEQQFLYNMELKCGCIQMEYQKKNNFPLISQVLYANQAMGRRKNVRAVCSSNCLIQFSLDNQVQQFRLSDISISHFSFILPKDQLNIELNTKIENIAFIIHGLRFRSNAVLFMTRPVENGTLYIFAFQDKYGKTELDPANKELLIPKIYAIMEENCSLLLRKLFSTAVRRRGNTTEVITEFQDSIE